MFANSNIFVLFQGSEVDEEVAIKMMEPVLPGDDAPKSIHKQYEVPQYNPKFTFKLSCIQCLLFLARTATLAQRPGQARLRGVLEHAQRAVDSRSSQTRQHRPVSRHQHSPHVSHTQSSAPRCAQLKTVRVQAEGSETSG